MAQACLCTDAAGILRGECRRSGCSAYSRERVQRLSLKPDESAQSPGSAEPSEDVCHSCGWPAREHRSLEDWWGTTRKWSEKFQDSHGMYAPLVADSFSLPAAAQSWSPEAAALYLVTQGQFDPRRDGRKEEDAPFRRREEGLVSVICTTIEKNHSSFPLLYECFQRQTYGPRELVVIDTGTQPSKFLQAKAKADPRVVYRFFFREEHGLEQEEDPLEHVMNEDRFEEVLHFVTWTPDFAEKNDAHRAEVPCQGLTLGVKRNIAAHLSRGSMLMHFNIGDVYSRDYMACMRKELLAVPPIPPHGDQLPPAAVSLGNWHAVDVTSRAFRRLDLLERGHHLPEEMRKSLQCARGFSFAYTRRTWELVGFPNVDHPEGQLRKVFQQHRIPFMVVTPMSSATGLAARGYDKAEITGGSVAASMNNAIEIRDLIDCSVPCETPTSFRDLVPAVEDMHSATRQIRDNRINELLEASGAAFFCVHCDAALALRQYLKEVKDYGDGAGGSVELAQFSRAGGAVAEGQDHPEAADKKTPVGRVPRARLTCASPGCSHRVHTDLDVGGYCCVVCYLSRGWEHGPRCERADTQYVNHTADCACLPRDAGPQLPMNVLPPERPEFQLPEPVVAPPIARTPMVLPKPQPRPLAQQLRSTDNWRNRFQPLQVPENKGSRPSVVGSLKPMLNLAPPSPWTTLQRGGPAQPQRTSPQPVVERRPPPPPKEPEPVNITWFPGWSWRNALCRHCGKAVGWRYEKTGGQIFWAFEQRHLVERLPPAAPRAAKVKVPVKQDEASRRAAAKAAAAEIAAAEAATAARAAEAAAAAEAATVAAATAARALAAAEEAPPPPSAAREDEDALEAGRKAIACFSLELRKQLATSLSNSSDKFCVDQALGSLRLDEPTRANLRGELAIDPGMAAVQADIWIAKCFRGKVYALRKMDAKVLRKVLEEAVSASASASTASTSASTSSQTPSKAVETPTAGAQASSSSSSSAPKEDKPAEEKPAEVETSAGDRQPAKEKAAKPTTPGGQAICSFSPELQRQLASGVAGSDGSGFDQVLNGLKLDDATRENLRKELMIRPGVNPLQVEQLIAKGFRGKVNMLRSLGLKKLRTALDEALPGGLEA